MFSKFPFKVRPRGRTLRWIRSSLPELNFLTIHYIYFLGVCMVFSILFWAIATPFGSVRFIDAVFLCVSAMTLAGLNTVNLSTLNTVQQIMLLILIMLGSAILVSAAVVHIRRKAFEKRFQSAIAQERRGRTKSWFPLTRSMSRGQSRTRSRDETATAQSGMQTDGSSEGIGVPYQLRGRQEIRRDLNDVASPEKVKSALDGSALEHSAGAGSASADSTFDSSKTSPHVPYIQTSSNRPEPILGEDHSETILASPVSETSPAPFALDPTREGQDRITFGSDTRFNPKDSGLMKRVFSVSGVGARSTSQVRRLTMQTSQRSRSSQDFPRTFSSGTRDDVISSGFLGRNSNFHHLTEEDRVRLGGTEYRAVVFLSWLVPIYYIAFQLLGCLALGAYVHNKYESTATTNGLNAWWVGAFNAVSAFNNSGMSLLDANMTVFNRAIFMLLTMILLILAGNTCYPIFLRFIVYAIRKFMPNNDDWKDARYTLQFLLDHPRRCYTNLFPAEHTWWLLLSVLVLNGIDCAAFSILNIGNEAITHLPPGIEFIDGLFQAAAVRAGGFYVVPIPSVRVSLQVLYVIMMYISAFPVAITIRNSNVYEERSLGIYSDDPGYDFVGQEKGTAMGWLKNRFGGTVGSTSQATKRYFVQQQLRAQLAHDIWWLVLAVFLIMIIEGSQFERSPAVFSVFNVIFEVVSAYGTVGISVGLPNEAYSFCGAWHTLSKLILCAVMLRGRHRGLPVAIDKAVLLPSEHLHKLEDEDAHIRSERAGPGVATA